MFKSERGAAFYVLPTPPPVPVVAPKVKSTPILIWANLPLKPVTNSMKLKTS